MGIITVKQYERLKEAKANGDMDLVKQIQDEAYGKDSTIIDVDIEEGLDFETIESEKAAGLSNGEIAKKYDVTVQKVNAMFKKGK